MIFVYPIFVPYAYWHLLYRKRKLINGGQKVKEETMVKKEALSKALEEREKNEEEHPDIKSMHFLYDIFQPKYWWFEVFEAFRKLGLTGFLVFLSPGTGVQVCISLLITVFALVVYSVTQPYKHPFANMLAQVAQWQLLLTILCALAIQTNMDGRELQSHHRFDVYLTSLQILPVLFVTVYFLVLKILSIRKKRKEQGMASVLPFPPDVVGGEEEGGIVEGGEEEKVDEDKKEEEEKEEEEIEAAKGSVKELEKESEKDEEFRPSTATEDNKKAGESRSLHPDSSDIKYGD